MNLNELIDGHVNGRLDAGQTAELSRALEDSPETRREFRSRIRVHAALSEHFSGEGDAEYQPFEPRRSIHLTAAKLVWTAAAVAVLAVFFWPRQVAPIAEIVSSESAEWDKPVGSTLNPGRQLLLRGMVELKIGHSVRVAIEAPADFDLIDTARMRLRSGRVAADVGELGHGFTIVTPEGEVIDLGTRFGVRVGGDGASEAHVFQGAVDVVRGGRTLHLEDEAAVSLTKFQPIAVEPWGFPMPKHELPVRFPPNHFESNGAPVAGFPRQADIWSGDSCKLVPRSLSGGVRPAGGAMILQFLSTRSATDSESTGQRASELWRIVDLQPFAEQVNTGKVTAILSGEFNRAPGVPNSEFRLELAAFRGQIADAEVFWDQKNKPTSARLASTSSSVVSDEDAVTWEPLAVGMAIPPGTDFLVLSLLAFENETERDENEFEAHFADNIDLSLMVDARRSEPIAFWTGEGAWSESSNWRGGGRPDPARERVIIEGAGEAVIDDRIATKQSIWITSGNDSIGRLRIAKNGELIKSGFGELVVGFNPGGDARLKIQGSLRTRCRVFIGRNNSTSTVEIDGGDWDAGGEVIRMAQYGNRGSDTIANLLIRNGGRLKAGALELVHDLATLTVENGEVELSELRVGGEDGEAVVVLSGGVLRVGELKFGSARGELRFESPRAELWLGGDVGTARQLLDAPNANWRVSGRAALPEHFVLEPAESPDGESFTKIRIRR